MAVDVSSEAPLRTARRVRLDIVWLAAAAVTLLLANGRWIVPACAWIAPACALRFLRGQHAGVRLAVLFVLLGGTTAATWLGLVPLHGMALGFLAAGMAALQVLPYVAHRLLAPRLRGLSSTLVLPLASVTVEYVTSLTNPYGTWGATAYTQTGDLPLLQLVSVTGIFGITFVVTWFASTLDLVLEREPNGRTSALVYTSVLAAILCLGGLRLLSGSATSAAVPVATITMKPGPAASMWRLLRTRTDTAQISALHDRSWALQDSLLAATARAIGAGARVVVWSELAALVLQEDEAAFVDEARRLSKRQGATLCIGLGTFTPGHRRMENKTLVLTPGDAPPVSYFKSHPVPGDPETGGPEVVKPVDSPWGRVAAPICFDVDFPGFVRQVGRANVGILLVPAHDWREIGDLHARMAVCRAVENGASLVRATGDGVSVAADSRGRILGWSSSFTQREGFPSLLTEVPGEASPTLYARAGDVFAWLCIAAMIVIAARTTWVAREARRRRIA